LALLTCSCSLFVAAASASTMSVTLSSAYPSAYSFYSYTATDGSAQNNIPVAPYLATLNQTGVFNNQTAYVICYDLNNPSNIGQAYTGHLAYNTDTATLEATYLANQLNLLGVYAAPTSLKGAISMAIWATMFPSSTKTDGSYFPADPAAQVWETQASGAVQSGLWTVADSNLYPTFIPDDTTSQRFGVIETSVTPPQITYVAPEPGTMWLLFIGVVLLAFGQYRN